MAEIKRLVRQELENIAGEHKFQQSLLIKDYYITILLYLLKDIEGIYFKGGTALNKTILNHSRISEDIDFTINRPLSKIREVIICAIDSSRMFGKITQDKDVDRFVRLIVPYDTEIGKGSIFIDLNERGRLLTPPKQTEIKHFYPNIPKFSVPCLSQEEMVAEKMAATIGRNKPRDHYDIYQIIKKKIPIDIRLAEQKCIQSGDEFNIIKMFNQGQKLHERWKGDLEPLLSEEITFKEIMSTLAGHFNLKAEKDRYRKIKDSTAKKD
jgi:predicted nucleotidyltransferase component of viral defense system